MGLEDYEGQNEARAALESSARAFAELEGREYDDYEEVEEVEDEDEDEDDEDMMRMRSFLSQLGKWTVTLGAGTMVAMALDVDKD